MLVLKFLTTENIDFQYFETSETIKTHGESDFLNPLSKPSQRNSPVIDTVHEPNRNNQADLVNSSADPTSWKKMVEFSFQSNPTGEGIHVT